MRIALLHSPLLGPSSWSPAAEALRHRGHDVVLPDLRAAVSKPPYGRRYSELATQALEGSGPWVLAGHSGAGRLMSTVAVPTTALVFVDAGLPGEPSHMATAPGAYRLHAVALADDRGMLPPWPEWWPAEALADLLPDEEQREAIRSDSPGVPLDLLLEPLPQAQLRSPCAYLSFTYESERAQAEQAGWPTASLEGTHLHQMVEPAAVAECIEALARSAAGPSA